MLVVVVVTFLVCWFLGSRVEVPVGLLAAADRYVIGVALPAVIIATMSRVDIDPATVLPVAVAWVSMAVCAGVVSVLGRVMHWSRETVGALLLVAVLGNTSFLGIGVVRALLGDDHVAAAISYDQLGTFLALATYGSWVAGRFGTGDHGARSVMRRLLQFPPFLALVASVGLRSVDIPDGVIDVLSATGRTVAPVAMGVLGLRFRLRSARGAVSPALWGLAVKMLCVPVLVACVALASGGRHDVAWAASVMQSAAPPMVTAGVVAVTAGLDEEVVSFMVGVGTLLAFVSLPLVGLAF